MQSRLHGSVDISLVELPLAQHEKVVSLSSAPRPVHNVGGARRVHPLQVHEAHESRAPTAHARRGLAHLLLVLLHQEGAQHVHLQYKFYFNETVNHYQ